MTKASNAAADPIRTFISYSWSSPDHESWVLALATRLRQDGVDIILDKWDLKPGHDSFKFMEQMVTDPSVAKVIMICDQKYTEKADKRAGGVGAESQIISPELYGKSSQDKFAAVISELGDDGRPYVPTYYKGRIYFDLSSSDKYEEQYEELLRWIVGKPLLVKPPIGAIPRHITEGATHASAAESRFRRADDAIRRGIPAALGFVRDFSDVLVPEFEKLRITRVSDDDYDELVVKSIADARPYVHQMLALTNSIARYSQDPSTFDEMPRIIERMGALMFRPEHVSQWREDDFDNFRYVCHEIFLGCCACLLREERFDLVERFLSRPYLMGRTTTDDGATSSFGVFFQHLRSLLVRNHRLKLNRLRVQADMLKSEYSNRVPSFDDVMQADFILYLRDARNASERKPRSWEPVTLVYSEGRYSPFDVFARCESKKYFIRVQGILAVKNVDEFKQFLRGLVGTFRFHDYGYRIPILRLANLDHIGIAD